MIMSLIENLKAIYGDTVRYLHCNNAGENEALELLCKQEEMELQAQCAWCTTTKWASRKKVC